MTAERSECRRDSSGLAMAADRNVGVTKPLVRKRNIYMGMPVQANAWEESPNANYALSSERPERSAQRVDTDVAKEKAPGEPLRHLIYQDYRRYRAAGAKNA